MDDVLLEKIREYRKMLQLDKPDLDVALLMKIFDITNEQSEVFIAIEPVSEDDEWVSDSPRFAVAGLARLDDGRLAMRVNRESHGMAAGDLRDLYAEELKRNTGSKMPVLFMKGDEVLQLTEAFSHSLVNRQWAGLPFDIVLGVRKRPAKAAEDGAEGDAESNAE